MIKEAMSEREKALDEFIESGALATNMCPDFLRDAYFEYGFDAGVKAERERIGKLIDEYQLDLGLLDILKADQQEQRSE